MLMANSYHRVQHSYLSCWLDYRPWHPLHLFSSEPQGFGNRYQGLRLCLT